MSFGHSRRNRLISSSVTQSSEALKFVSSLILLIVSEIVAILRVQNRWFCRSTADKGSLGICTGKGMVFQSLNAYRHIMVRNLRAETTIKQPTHTRSSFFVCCVIDIVFQWHFASAERPFKDWVAMLF